jgi:hypothetical protein
MNWRRATTPPVTTMNENCTHENTKDVRKKISRVESIVVDTICLDCGESV